VWAGAVSACRWRGIESGVAATPAGAELFSSEIGGGMGVAGPGISGGVAGGVQISIGGP
jgi:hypothetical protein